MVLLDDFGDIVLKTADLCSAKDDCVRLKNALVNLGNSKDWDALVKRANAGKLDGVNVLLRPVSAESLDNLVATSTAPFITHETARAAQSLNSPAPGGFLIVSDEGSDFVDQPWPSASLYDYPPQEQWNAFQKLAQMLMHTPFNAEGIVTKIFTDANGTQHIGLHPIPDRSGLWRYLSTTLLLLTMLGSAIYNGVQAWRRYHRHRPGSSGRRCAGDCRPLRRRHHQGGKYPLCGARLPKPGGKAHQPGRHNPSHRRLNAKAGSICFLLFFPPFFQFSFIGLLRRSRYTFPRGEGTRLRR